jgi:hypothetical protein
MLVPVWKGHLPNICPTIVPANRISTAVRVINGACRLEKPPEAIPYRTLMMINPVPDLAAIQQKNRTIMATLAMMLVL